MFFSRKIPVRSTRTREMLRHVLIALALVASAAAQFPGARRAAAGSWTYNNGDEDNGNQIPPAIG